MQVLSAFMRPLCKVVARFQRTGYEPLHSDHRRVLSKVGMMRRSPIRTGRAGMLRPPSRPRVGQAPLHLLPWRLLSTVFHAGTQYLSCNTLLLESGRELLDTCEDTLPVRLSALFPALLAYRHHSVRRGERAGEMPQRK